MPPEFALLYWCGYYADRFGYQHVGACTPKQGGREILPNLDEVIILD
jgi:hypothetical protein